MPRARGDSLEGVLFSEGLALHQGADLGAMLAGWVSLEDAAAAGTEEEDDLAAHAGARG